MRIAALFNILLSTFESGHLRKHNRDERESEAQEQLRDEERAKLAVVGGGLDNARRLIWDSPAVQEIVFHALVPTLTQQHIELLK